MLCPPDSSYLISRGQGEYSTEKARKNQHDGECTATDEEQQMDTQEDDK